MLNPYFVCYFQLWNAFVTVFVLRRLKLGTDMCSFCLKNEKRKTGKKPETSGKIKEN